MVVPSSAGGGTDALARAFSEAAKKHLPQPVIVVNKPGASGAVGMAEVMNAKPDGYKVCVLIAELAILPALGQIKFTADDFKLIARLNADPSAVTVTSSSPSWTRPDPVTGHRRTDNSSGLSLGMVNAP